MPIYEYRCPNGHTFELFQKMSDAPADYLADQLGRIVGLEIAVTRLEGKRKLSQNREARDALGLGRGWKRIFKMSRRCELTAKGPQVGHKVSHSNIKTKRRFLPNLVNVTFISDALARNVRLRVSTNALKSVDHNGGLDALCHRVWGRLAAGRLAA